jgi:16S rRNA G966 N2-methylase RsmD
VASEIGIPAEAVKPTLDRIKEDVFSNLKPKQIDSQYFKLLKALKAHLPKSKQRR